MIKKKLQNKSGMTLVEMIVSFALLALFITAAFACITPVLLSYHRMQNVSHQQLVADTILQDVAANATTMGGAYEENDGYTWEGYIKIRGDAADPQGQTLECMDLHDNHNYIMQIDTLGCTSVAYRQSKERQGETYDIPANITTVRYYEMDKENPDRGLTKIIDGATGTEIPVVRSLAQCYVADFIKGYDTVKLGFTIPASAVYYCKESTGERTNAEDIEAVPCAEYLEATVYLTNSTGTYQQSRVIYLENVVQIKDESEPTLDSD